MWFWLEVLVGSGVSYKEANYKHNEQYKYSENVIIDQKEEGSLLCSVCNRDYIITLISEI